MSIRSIFLLALFAITATVSVAQKNVLTVTVDKPAGEIQPTMWGIFFEDINYGADGGLYPELVKNRSFEFDVPLMGWTEENYQRYSVNKKSGSAMIINRGDDAAKNPRFARVNVNTHESYAMVNEGFFGMGVKNTAQYDFSILAKSVEGNFSIVAEIIDPDKKVLAKATVTPDSREWKKYNATLTPSATTAKGKLRLSFSGNGVIDIDMVSLFPKETFKNRPGGLRADIAQLLADLKPGFLRFPGGCIVEGRDLSERYQWKKTVGNVEERELMYNRWNAEFKHRPSPDYFQSFGLGFYEYFQLAEDIGASPLPILSCGMACQFNTAELVPMEEIDPYIQDALDLIEFANGAATTKWGKLREDMGHPKPFNLTMIGIGNEQWGPQYFERYKVFEKAIKSKYPDIKIVSSAGPFADGELFDFAWQELKALNPDIVDEHYYKNPEWFFQHANRYDQYDRKGPKIFAGEYAAQSVATVSPDNKNNWQCALSEAAFMTGLERNADVVYLASYAPLLAHAEGWQWTPDLIWFDNLKAYATPNYYVQKLFGNNKGTHILSVKANNENVTGQNNLYASAVWDKNTKEIIIKIVNASDKPQNPEIVLAGAGKLNTKVSLTVLTSSLNDVNSFQEPAKVKPAESTITIKGKSIKTEFAPYSLSIVKVKAL